MSLKSLFVAVFCFFFFFSYSQNRTAIIPQPVSFIQLDGTYLITEKTGLSYPDEIKQAVAFFSKRIEEISGINLLLEKNEDIKIIIDNKKVKEEEGYWLDVTEKGILIVGNNYNGVLYAFQSILQTLPHIRTNAKLEVPAMKIIDFPRFKWRGMHLDVSRHFFSIETIKEYIDLLAMYKLNIFHWHLVDDHGWRIEIKKYPKLTSVGAWRVDRYYLPFHEREPAKEDELPTYGGYYTQEQIRETVKYAAERGVTVVPEIELPGHSEAAISSYPFLSCRGIEQLVSPGAIQPAHYQNVFCAGKDSVFNFIQDVLSEVITLFPSYYIHIGGDEVNKSYWQNCPKCNQRMKKEKLNSHDELQSYFIKRMERFINSKNRTIIGWDEILEGGLAPNAAVMSWQGETGGIKAAKMNHYVVMTPSVPLYFDYYQGNSENEPHAPGGNNSLKMVYDYNPIPSELNEQERKYILGAQANVWTESIKTREHLEYMVLPRMLGLSEAVWTPVSEKSWISFLNRLKTHLRAFDDWGLRYRNVD